LLLLPGAKPPVAIESPGKPVCSCFNVRDTAIEAHLQSLSPDDSTDARLASLQGALKCGTNCGSCIPELKRRVRASHATEATPPRPVIAIRQIA